MIVEAGPRRGHLAARALNLTTALPDTRSLHPDTETHGCWGLSEEVNVAVSFCLLLHIRLMGWITESGSSSPSQPHYTQEGKRSKYLYKTVAFSSRATCPDSLSCDSCSSYEVPCPRTL